MGRQDQRFAEANGTVVGSRKGFPRYFKRFNAKGQRKHGQFSVRPENRSGSQFKAQVGAQTERAD